nr:retrovirus-related Pol polyprotein from transposon TNT 1-94 [Tanacetum cinerariifolium]
MDHINNAPEKDPSEEHEPEDDDEDPEEDPNEEHEPEDSDETELFEEDEIAITPPPPRHSHRATMIHRRDDILEEDMPPRRRFALTGSPPGCDVAESSAAAARAPRSQYNFVDTVEEGYGLIRSPGNDTRTIARAAEKAEDVSYVRALQASERRMMTSIEEVNLRVSYQAQIDVVRGQRTSYETELQEVHHAYLSFKAQNMALLTRLKTLKTHMRRMEWQHQSTEDLAVTQMMRIHTLEARARTDTVKDANNSCNPKELYHTQDDASQSSGRGLRRPMQPAHVCSYTDFMKCQPLNFKGTEGVFGLSQWLEKMESVFHISGCAIDNQVKFTTCTLLGAALTWWNGHVRTLGHDAAYAMTWGTLKKKLMDKYCPKERHNESKRKANDSPRNNQQQPHKKQYVARAYTADPGEKKKLHMASVTTTTDDWWYKSGATTHVCNNKDLFKTYKKTGDRHEVMMGDNHTSKFIGSGNVEIQFTSEKKLTLINVLRVPYIRKNLVSSFKLCKSGVKAVI